MPIEYLKRYTREEIRDNPDKLYVFGDNFLKAGRGGQAKECRGEPNCVGIPTKRYPSMRADAFLSDDDYVEWTRKCQKPFHIIFCALVAGKVVVFPTDGIGTGLARLEEKAPQIWKSLQNSIDALAETGKGSEQ